MLSLLSSLLLITALEDPDLPAGHVVIASYATDRVVESNEDGQTVRLYGEDLVLDGPWDVEFGPDGRLTVSSSLNNRVVTFNPDGTTHQIIEGAALDGEPRGLCYGPGGLLFVAMHATSQIVIVDPIGLGEILSTMDCPQGAGSPNDLAFDSTGSLWIASEEANGLAKISPIGVLEQIIATPSPPCFMGLLDSYTFWVSLPESNMAAKVHTPTGEGCYDTTAGCGNDIAIAYPGCAGIAFANNGNLVLGSKTTDTIQRFNFGPDGNLLWSHDLDQPLGIAVAPTAFKVRIQGELLGPSIMKPLEIDTEARLRLYNGREQCYLTVAAGQAMELVNLTGASRWTFVGRRTTALETPSTAFSNTPVAYVGAQVDTWTPGGGLSSIAIEHILKLKNSIGVLDFRKEVKKLSAKVHLVGAGATFVGKLTKPTFLNKAP